LVPGLLEIARRNLSRGLTDLALYEVGVVFLPEEGATYGSGPLPAGDSRPGPVALAELNGGIPPQPWHIAALFTGDAITKQPGIGSVPAGIADALSSVEQIASALAVDIRVVQGTHPSLHPGRAAELWVDDRPVGFAGELLPALAAELDLPRVVAVVELDLDALIDLARVDVAPTPINAMPAATQDLSLVVARDVPAGDVLASVIEGAGDLLENAVLVDDYRGSGVAATEKSLTFALRFRAPDRTLTAAEATDSKKSAAALAASRHGATIRE
jgi:phenylalanyl-tRNA synthetase beta chain